MSDAVSKPTSHLASLLAGAGIFLSRIVGLVRERLVAACFGTGLHADVFSAGLRLPNVLQNMLGEGTLSASFIPVYSHLLGEGKTQEAGRVAGAAFALLLAVAGGISLLGVAFSPLLVSLFTPGFEGQRRELMVTLVRILFPMTGILVLSAWSLGILNSHRKFFIPYFAPVLWNAAIIAALLAFNGRVNLDALLMAAAWGALLGGVLQFGFQLPWVIKLERNFRLNSGKGNASFKEMVRNAGPAILGRGVVQLGSYVDVVLASLLAIGAVSRMRYAQTLYVLPISLFAMSIAATELPELSRQGSASLGALRDRVVSGVRRVSFYVVPSLVAFVALGNVFVAGIYQSGEFHAADVQVVWLTLMAYSAGLLATTNSRIYQSAFFALRDTKTTSRIATLRIVSSALAGAALMLQFESITLGTITLPAGIFRDVRAQGLPLGPVGLATGAAIGSWLEWVLLRGALTRQLGGVGAGLSQLSRMFASALIGAAAGYGAHRFIGGLHPLMSALVVAAVFGGVYLGASLILGVTEAKSFIGMITRRFSR